MSRFRLKPAMFRLPATSRGIPLAVPEPCDPPPVRWWRRERVRSVGKPERVREIPWFLEVPASTASEIPAFLVADDQERAA